jgi:hypothetical protein
MIGRHYQSGNGVPSGVRTGKLYRGSRKRVQRIKVRENTSVELWIFVLLMLFLLFVGLPWLTKHPPADHHHLVGERPAVKPPTW